jgi:hypothetical protein
MFAKPETDATSDQDSSDKCKAVGIDTKAGSSEEENLA